ncbi:heterokaryon incompatibility protein-domain-containing protein [Annulohypoxylon moriforme]|nr:heterokaryon incompatibility protein-domain-containing protein [Annulohypoxylon moriforme]
MLLAFRSVKQVASSLTMTNIDVYQYQSLCHERAEFRLLQIVHSEVGRPLMCRLVHVTLDTFHPYDALSYTWSNPFSSPPSSSDSNPPNSDKGSIMLEGKPFTVSKNLQDAFGYLSRISDKFLWIDAVCIDQLNARERAQQVRLMGRIFSSAQRVLAWLGPPSPCSPLAMELLEMLAINSRQKDRVSWLIDVARDPKFFEHWAALNNFVSRTWWKRAWVIQEYVLSSRVVFACGDDELAGEDMNAAAQLLYDEWNALFDSGMMQRAGLNARVLDPMWNLLELRRRYKLNKGFRTELMDPLSLLSRTRQSLASDPRDRLFAKFDMIGESANSLCAPNYTMPSFDIFRSFFEAYVQQTHDLYIICHAGLDFKSEMSWPTWLPNWSSERFAYPLRCSWTGAVNDWPRYNASSDFRPSVEILPGNTILRCQGLVVDEVDGVQFDPWCTKSWETRDGQQSRSTKCAYGTAEEKFEALYRTLVADTNRRVWRASQLAEPEQAPRCFGLIFGRTCEHYDKLLEPLQHLPGTITTVRRDGASNMERRWHGMRDLRLGGVLLRDVVRQGLSGQELRSTVPQPFCDKTMGAPFSSASEWVPFEHSYGQAMYRRRLFTTVNGYLGISTRALKQGDKVCVLRGCPVPVLLRPIEAQYENVGEAYVHGLMNGEALSPQGDDKVVDWISIELR